MTGLSRALASIASDLAEHDELTIELGEEASDYVEVKRADLEALVAAADRHQSCRNGWINLGPNGLAALRNHMEHTSG